IVTGMGLLHWHEILRVTANAPTAGRAAQEYLRILVTDARAIRARQPQWKRLTLRVLWQPPSCFRIASELLDRPADELARQIEQYVATHAPPGWPGRTAADDASAPAPKSEP